MQREKDRSGKFILISNDFYYFGEKAISLNVFQKLIKTGPGHRTFDDKKLIEKFICWLRQNKMGKLGDPIERRKENGNACKSAPAACRD